MKIININNSSRFKVVDKIINNTHLQEDIETIQAIKSLQDAILQLKGSKQTQAQGFFQDLLKSLSVDATKDTLKKSIKYMPLLLDLLVKAHN